MTATGARMLAWVRRRMVLLVATIATVAFVALLGVVTLRVAGERQARLASIERLADENRRLATQLCEGTNDTNATVRFVLDGSFRNRSPDAPPISDAVRRLTVDTYRRLPSTDCQTGAKTYFDPPFPTPGGP